MDRQYQVNSLSSVSTSERARPELCNTRLTLACRCLNAREQFVVRLPWPWKISRGQQTMLSTVLKFLPLIILGRAGLCKLNVVAPPQVQQVLEEVCIARQEIPLWSSSQNLDDWSNAWAKHWNTRLAQQFDVIHELSGTRFAFAYRNFGCVEGKS